MTGGGRIRPSGCVCEGPEPSPFCYPCMTAAAQTGTVTADPIVFVFKSAGVLTAGQLRACVNHLDGLGISDDAPAEVRPPKGGGRVEIAFRRSAITTTPKGRNTNE
ncbi:hypothetical protein SEA_EVANESCE_57 [Mycobacterium phage Evanesce]|uniref:Uncharacterized protein n=13 Tax=Caudoviricetes TaxID=2731619 RepID=A0A8T8JE72_9CAUD|nr:hypothetical protein Giles_55 [Mycobacterium phage Giles]AKQ07833.1 hypothetical protein SEA_KINBOTE_57 [Mycobacterium phage Kinbote]ALF00278.1 hypothetical protein SEA_EVANESCE_57 [Mycobacterium phage Evanesce]ATN90452.1 hypothetical protein SEA_LILHAZELNUT_58 [Mycobacterium phage LilHazelnut]QBQ71285.1 hypothetical protein SEA_DAEGAL_60 [Mycobacterium phage Daegal]QDH48798.1 hypothetical protein SEA_DEEPSOIL15_58 [Mycobacterium phage DeepSoil15]QIQ62677.1 hypothetical protein SEA_EIN37_5